MKIFIASDTHCGHDVGLTTPEFNWKPSERASRAEHKAYEFRVKGWEWFSKEVEKFGPFDEAIWNGDIVDGSGDSSGGTEDQELPVQVEMAVAVVNFVNSRVNHFNRGTPYHTGKMKTTWEDMVCGMCKGATIGDEGHYKFNGLSVTAKHKIGNSSSPVSRYTALGSAAIKQLLWAETGQQPKANLIIRSHIHRCSEVSDPAMNKAVWVTPALQGLGSVYGARNVDGLPVHFGFLVLHVEDENNWGIDAHIASLELQKALVYEVNIKTA
jgi:hypothetical protein